MSNHDFVPMFPVNRPQSVSDIALPFLALVCRVLGHKYVHGQTVGKGEDGRTYWMGYCERCWRGGYLKGNLQELCPYKMAGSAETGGEKGHHAEDCMWWHRYPCNRNCFPTFLQSSQNQTVSSGVEGAHEGTTADKKGESREPEKLNNAQKSVAAAAEPHHRKCGLLHGDTACNCSLWHALCNIQDYIVCEEETPERKLYVVGNELIERIKQNFALAESSLVDKSEVGGGEPLRNERRPIRVSD